MNEIHVSKAAESYHEGVRYTPNIPKDYKHIINRHYATIKRTERRRQRIASVMFITCVIVGLCVTFWAR